MEELVGDWNDPSAYIERFPSRSPRGHSGWKDEGLDALIDGSVNPAAFAAAPDKGLAVASDARLLAAGSQEILKKMRPSN